MNKEINTFISEEGYQIAGKVGVVKFGINEIIRKKLI